MRNLHSVTRGVFFFLALGLATSLDVSAQLLEIGRPDLVDIEVRFEGDRCEYVPTGPNAEPVEVRKPSGDGTYFRIRAHGFLRFVAKGVPATVRIEDDLQKEARGYAHRGMARLYPGRTETIRVREKGKDYRGAKNLGPDSTLTTLHRINIDCCTGGITNAGVCVGAVPAPHHASLEKGISDVKLTAGDIPIDELARLTAGQNSADDAPFPVAGPDMEVDP